MRKVVLFIATSLDGLIATPEGGIDWLFTDQDYGYHEFFARIDTVILGRKTYEQVLGFGEYPYAGTQGFVLTRSPAALLERQTAVHPSVHSITLVDDQQEDWLRSLRQSAGRDIWLVGGAQIVQLFMQRGWIDELILSVHPVILGAGMPLFLPTQTPPQAWQLVETQPFDSGLVQLSYRKPE